MHFLVDAQLPPMLCGWLEEQGHEASYVGTVLSGEAPDRTVRDYAVAQGLVLVSKDEDFVTRYPPGNYALVWLRIGNATNRTLLAWLAPRWLMVVAALARGERLVEVR